MQRLPVTVAFVADEPTAEQRQALSWCDRTAEAVETLAPDALDDASLTDYDAVWWHCASDPAPPETDALRTYVEDGGGLLLTLRALEAVDALGIDPVVPDATGHGEIAAPAGFARRSLHDDHPLFEALPEQFHTRLTRGGQQAFARYERALPVRGDVLACDVRGEDRLAARKTALGWHLGDGYALGIGDALAFDVEGGVETANGARLVRNALAVLGGRRPTFTGRPDDAAGLRAVRERLADDHHRPRYHVSPPANWLNDPNGLVHHEGRFHVFYQYNPGGPFHNAIHWGHAVSDDLVQWRDEPVALAPGPDGPDRDGCWSGCAVPDGGAVRFLYTGGRDREQLPCMATATDDSLRTLVKYPDNPIIEETPDDPAILETDDWSAEFRDHCVWRDDGDDCWYQVIGSGVQGEGGTVLLYRAEDLTEWEYVGPLLVGQDGDGTVWECPELLEFGSEYLLQVSNYDVTRYFVGRADYDEPSFAVESEGLIDHGDFYAPQSMHTEDGRVLMWGWLQEARDPDAQWEAGWSGLLSLPRELDCEDGLRQRPARELVDLRERHAHEGEHALAAGEHRALDAPGEGCEVRARIDPEPGGTVELGVRESPALTERTVLRYDADAGELAVDRRESSLDDRVTRDVKVAPVEADGPLDLHVFVDGSVVELFADEHTCLTSRIYPTREDATGLSVAARDGAAEVALDVWELGSSWATGR